MFHFHFLHLFYILITLSSLYISGQSSPPDGRLPSADMGSRKNTIQHIRDVFYRMGFNDQDIVALLGAHSLGRCHTDASGYWGPWTFGESTFSNEYFRLLLEERWAPKITHDGKSWEGPDQYGTFYCKIDDQRVLVS